MCTKGSSWARSTPAKARRTGNPSPSKPDGASVTDTTGRSWLAPSGKASRGREQMSSTVTAGMAWLLGSNSGSLWRTLFADATFPRSFWPGGGERALVTGHEPGPGRGVEDPHRPVPPDLPPAVRPHQGGVLVDAEEDRPHRLPRGEPFERTGAQPLHLVEVGNDRQAPDQAEPVGDTGMLRCSSRGTSGGEEIVRSTRCECHRTG